MTTVNSRRTHARVQLFLTGALGLSMALVSAQAAAAPAANANAAKDVKAETADQKSARSLLERGQKELKAGHPEQALASFSAAQKLDASLPVAEAIANATLALGKPADAARGYSTALEANRSTLTKAALATAQIKLDELKAASAELVLDVSELGAEVQLDAVDVGRTPLPPLLVNPGPHQITLKKQGFVSLTQQVLLVRGANAQTLKMASEVFTGKLKVSSNTTHATSELLIDNQVVGLLPWEGTLPVGKVTLIGRSSDESSAPVEAMVQRDVTTPIVLELKPNAGTLEVSALATGVRISLDGQPVGVQSFRGPLSVGRHHLKLERDGFVTQEQDVDVRMNETSSFVIGNWVPLKAPLPPPADDHGMYYRLDLAFTFSNKTDGLTEHCEEQSTNVQCSTHAPLGGVLAFRAGYRFKWIAPELWGIGSFSAQFAEAHFDPSLPADSDFYGPKRSEDYVLFRYGWAAGAGVRVTSPTRSISATGGLGFGVFSMWGQYARATQGTQGGILGSVPAASSTKSSVSHTYAPGFLLDGGVLFGSSPGAKLYLGVMLEIEFAPEHAPVAPQSETTFGMDAKYDKYGTPGLDIVSGTQFRFGPVLGFQFGY